MDYLQPKFYRFSQDSLWLAQTAADTIMSPGRDKLPASLLDIGSGCGVIGIEAANKLSSIQSLTLLEPQEEFAQYLKLNLDMLETSPKVELSLSTIKNYAPPKKLFDLVLCNPPYFNLNESRLSPDKKRARCRFFLEESLLEFAEEALRLTAPEGEAYILARESNPDVAKVLKVWKDQIEVAAKSRGVLILNLFHEKGR
ncbi:MAG: methyltransferase [Bacteriovoracaceae bacterium]